MRVLVNFITFLHSFKYSKLSVKVLGGILNIVLGKHYLLEINLLITGALIFCSRISYDGMKYV